MRVANGSNNIVHSIAREGAGQSIEAGDGPLSLPAGDVITLQLVNTNEWEIIADTRDKSGLDNAAVNALIEAQLTSYRRRGAITNRRCQFGYTCKWA